MVAWYQILLSLQVRFCGDWQAVNKGLTVAAGMGKRISDNKRQFWLQ
jgi:hypothetical protein